jgi:cation diffusion facilitator CzcD-associated flavoprotein CzcO
VHGSGSFAGLGLIPTSAWHDYLQWYRRVLALPVRNGVAATAIVPGELLPADRRAHTCETTIDFERLRGRPVAVLGAGASAMDNAAVALEHGAAVHLFCRRASPSVVQRYRWLTFAGFLKHIGEMPDEWRWRIMGNILRAREGFPADTYKRVMAFPNFTMQLGRNWTDARMEDGCIRLETTRGPFHADYAICGTGIRQDVHLRPELAGFADKIALWRHRYTPPPGEEDPLLGAYPYLGPDYAFLERTPGEAPWLADIHLFGIGSTASFGPSGSSINAMTTAVPKVAAGVTRGLFEGDLQRHWESLLVYDVKQVELDWSRMATG